VVTYWDTSCLVPLIVKEDTTPCYLRIAKESGIVTWWGSYIECVAAVVRHAREGESPGKAADSFRLLDTLRDDWLEISANEQLRRAAVRAVRSHGLRSGDALQLGAGMIASGFEPHSARFLSRDLRLRKAAEREGFVID
jgi:predicted nucleic acid-binding protein